MTVNILTTTFLPIVHLGLSCSDHRPRPNSQQLLLLQILMPPRLVAASSSSAAACQIPPSSVEVKKQM
jgi:hypothetical protein